MQINQTDVKIYVGNRTFHIIIILKIRTQKGSYLHF